MRMAYAVKPWLIESVLEDVGPGWWYTGNGWTHVIDDALQLARYQDAYTLINKWALHGCIAVQPREPGEDG